MTLWLTGAVTAVLSVFLFLLYIHVNSVRLNTTPPAALAVSPKRCTPEVVRSMAKQMSHSPDSETSFKAQLPPKTGRRYIVVGGGGFLGGWIVSSLLSRGEDPEHIRILDIRPPVREDLHHIPYIKMDVSDRDTVLNAFSAPWPGHTDSIPPEITVFHTAANIRFYERHESLLSASERVNVKGTEHIIDATRAIGASILIYTSSGSVAIRRSHFFLWPWQSQPKHHVQVVTDDDTRLPTKHDEFFSNYAATKIRAEKLVRAADNAPLGKCGGTATVLRTGCLRPGNGMFGPRGDMLCGAYLVRGTNPTWIANIVQSLCYVENCALAHLCYEQRLIELQAPQNGRKKNPDIGGQAFGIADPGPVQTYGDVYTVLETLTDGQCTFPNLPPTLMLIMAYLIETYYVSRHFMVNSRWRWAKVVAERYLPPINGDLVNLQPSLFALTSVHLIVDDSRARLPPEQGGLGYQGAWTTIEGLFKTVEEHKNGIGQSGRRSDLAGVSLGFGMWKAQRAVARVNEKAVDKLGVDPVKMMSTKIESP